MQRGFTFTRYKLPGGRRTVLVYRVIDEIGRALGYVQPTVSDASNVVWRCYAPYVPFPELAGDHPTREAAGNHLAFLADLREFRYRRVEAAE